MSLAGGLLFEATNAGRLYAIGGDGADPSTRPDPFGGAAQTQPHRPPSAPPAAAATVRSHRGFVWERDRARGPDFIPTDIALRSRWDLWVTDLVNNRFAIFSPEGEFLEYWGTSGCGRRQVASSSEFNGDSFGGLAFAPDGSFFIHQMSATARVLHFDADRNFCASGVASAPMPGQFQLTRSGIASRSRRHRACPRRPSWCHRALTVPTAIVRSAIASNHSRARRGFNTAGASPSVTATCTSIMFEPEPGSYASMPAGQSPHLLRRVWRGRSPDGPG